MIEERLCAYVMVQVDLSWIDIIRRGVVSAVDKK